MHSLTRNNSVPVQRKRRAGEKVRDVNPNSILVVTFFDAKGKELADIFSDGNIQIRRQAYDIITAIDPSNRSNYEKIIQN